MIHGGNVWEGNDPAQWLDFSANLRPSGPPEWVREVLLSSLHDVRYYPDPEMRAARSGLAAYLGVPEAQVLPTAGGAAAIDLALTRRSGHVCIDAITFGEYASRARVHGRPVIAFDPDSPEDCAGGTVILCNPNNPTGAVLSPDEVQRIHRTAAGSGGELIVDEAFIDFSPENTVRHAVSDTLTIVGSLTKILCIPGVRLGYTIGDPEVLSGLRAQQLPWSLSTQAAAVAAALPLHTEELQADVRMNRKRRTRFADALRSIGAKVSPSAANFLLVTFDRDMQPVIPYLKARGILIRDCASFGLPGSCLRLAVRLDEENDRLTEELRTWLKH